MLQRIHKVAILNYPLMDKEITTNDYSKYFKLDYESIDNFEVPLYIHIPFCSRICKFCIYNRIVADEIEIINSYVKALIEEIKHYGQTPYIRSMKIGAIFFGGGTPSCLSAKQLEDIIMTCRNNLPLTNNVEITVECNPLSTDKEKIHRMREIGVTRISAGIQTLNAYYRRILGLVTTTEEAIDWIKMVHNFRFEDLAIDIMYGLPGQTIDEWRTDICMATSLPVSHLSIYELYIMSGSRLYEELNTMGISPCPSAEVLFNMYWVADMLLKEKNFEHHIIPEYNKPGKKVKFWELTYDGYGDNLSLGASSFGYINGITYQNIVKVDEYIKSIASGSLPVKMVSQQATLHQLMERTVVLALRRGFIESDIFQKQYGKSLHQQFEKKIEQLLCKKLLVEYDGGFKLTTEGEYIQGDVSVQFMESTFRGVSSLRRQMAIGSHIVPTLV